MTPQGLPLVLVALLSAGCTGVIQGDAEGEPSPIASAASGGAAAGAQASVGYAPAFVPRLTHAQYVNSVRDLLGDVAALVAGELDLADPISENDHTFRSMRAAGNGLVDIAAEHVSQAAFEIARAAASDLAQRSVWLGCTPTGPADPCVTTGIRSLLQRAYRRPLTEQELGAYQGLIVSAAAENNGDVWRGVEAALAALLQSPNFVFDANVGEPDPTAPRRRYTGSEMAGRLALLLWGSVPDEALLTAAANGSLQRAEGARDAAERLLADPRARRGLTAFGSDLLEADRLNDLAKDAVAFPRYNAALADAMGSQIERTFARVVVEQDGDVLDLLTSRQTFVNDDLATLYGLPTVGSAELREVTLPADSKRVGLLGMAGFLAVHAGPTEGSIIKRGVFINERLLCRELGMPPAAAAMNGVGSAETGARTLRERTTASTSPATCTACHSQINPLGFGLEQFDGVGALRDTDAGQPIDASGSLGDVAFNGEPALAEAIRASDAVGRCFVTQLYRYATGHQEQPAEAPHLAALQERFLGNGRRLQGLLVDLVSSDAFRYAPTSEVP